QPGPARSDGEALMRATSRAARPEARDAGMVTVEAAVALCAFLTMLVLILAGAAAVLDQLRCTDAAREAARLVAMGQQSRAATAVNAIAPRGATFNIATTGDAVTVEVSANPVGGLLPGVHVTAEAYAIREPDTDGGTQ